MARPMKPSGASEPVFGTLEARTAAALLATAGDIALVLDSAGVIRDISVGGDEALFDRAHEWIGRVWADTVTPETRPKVESLLRDAQRHGVSKRRHVNQLLQDGSEVPLHCTGLRFVNGEIVAVGRDLRHLSTLQQRLVEAQQAMERDYWRLRHVETRYRLLFQLASDAILVLDAATLRVLEANSTAAELFGEPAEALVNRAFPFDASAADSRALLDLLASARTAGRAGDATVTIGERQLHVSASCFRQETATLLLVRLAVADAGSSADGASGSAPVLELLAQSPDAFVVTDLEGRLLYANRAFLDIAELASLDQAQGSSLGTWIGRPGADFPVFLSMLRKHGIVRLAATSARGSFGAQGEVELSATWLPDADEPCIGFSMRDIGRRLAATPQGARDLTRAVEGLTTLVGRVALRDLVRDTIDLVERHFIEAALELTNENRTSAAEVLGVSRQSLYVKLRRHKLGGPGSGEDEEATPE